ncbi:hypothetical protein NPIL_675161 [Nephila pilipes]|uniref:Uncharacterized protein n=1 Tax=Nephila pilipes TaxID=299642 RepID=A0A8X6N4R5_NEPPI|nr:hypothetical protein NPIL_675161 [Nephila pilipes]
MDKIYYLISDFVPARIGPVTLRGPITHIRLGIRFHVTLQPSTKYHNCPKDVIEVLVANLELSRIALRITFPLLPYTLRSLVSKLY